MHLSYKSIVGVPVMYLKHLKEVEYVSEKYPKNINILYKYFS